MLDRTKLEVAIGKEKEKLRLEIGKLERRASELPTREHSQDLGMALGRARALTWVLGQIASEDQPEMGLRTPESFL
jgi:hypothetical protein